MQDKFIIKPSAKFTPKLKRALKKLGPAIFEIQSIEINHDTNVGYRLKVCNCQDSNLNDITHWWVDDSFIEENFTKLDSSSTRFLMIGTN